MIRLIIKLAIVGLIVHAAVKIGPVFWTNLRYKDALAETAKFASKRTIADVQEKARKIATDLEIPSTEDGIVVAKREAVTIIDTRYTAQLEYFPKRYYPWEFVIHVEEGPPRYADSMP
jgi:hypothetical protein